MLETSQRGMVRCDRGRRSPPPPLPPPGGLVRSGQLHEQTVVNGGDGHGAGELEEAHVCRERSHGGRVVLYLRPQGGVDLLQAPLDPLGLPLADQPGLPLLGRLVGPLQAHGLPVPLQPASPLLVRLLHALHALGLAVAQPPQLPLLFRFTRPLVLLRRALALQTLQPGLQGFVLPTQGPLPHGRLGLDQLLIRHAAVAHQQHTGGIHRHRAQDVRDGRKARGGGVQSVGDGCEALREETVGERGEGGSLIGARARPRSLAMTVAGNVARSLAGATGLTESGIEVGCFTGVRTLT